MSEYGSHTPQYLHAIVVEILNNAVFKVTNLCSKLTPFENYQVIAHLVIIYILVIWYMCKCNFIRANSCFGPYILLVTKCSHIDKFKSPCTLMSPMVKYTLILLHLQFILTMHYNI